MSQTPRPDWDPTSSTVLRDQYAAYDEMREKCPVAYSELLGWSLFRHEDVVRVLHEPETFSNAVSRHLSVPNGFDPPEHTEYRRVIDLFFRPERMKAFEPACRAIAADLAQAAVARHEVEFNGEFCEPFAGRIQSAFLDWPADMHGALGAWMRRNRQATSAQDRELMAEVASEFADHIDRLLKVRRGRLAGAGQDVMAGLLNARVWGRALHDEEIVSIVRNWTAGEVGTISAAVGILAQYLADHPDLQQELRDRPGALPTAIDEILRIRGPLVANRRITTRSVDVGGRAIGAGERITLMWIAANRDGSVFEDPLTFRWDRDPAENLLYGAGIHVCPGAPLARLELRVVMEELLRRTTRIEPVPDKPPINAVYPASGFAELHLKLV